MRLAQLILLLALVICPAFAADRIQLQSAPALLDLDNRDRSDVGRLAWRGGVVVSSSDSRFGGYSGLEILDDGRRLLALSDVGHWLLADIAYDAAGNLAGLGNSTFAPLLGVDGKPTDSKRLNDAEALRRQADGSYLVAFERAHRVARFRAGADGLPLDSSAEAVATPRGVAGQPDNGGLEAMAVLAGGALLLISEDGRTPEGHAQAWLRDAEGTWHDLAYRVTPPFVPVDATVLPDGRLLVLERRYHPIGGVGARLAIVNADTIRAGAVLQGEEIANLAAPVTVDNFEAVAARRGARGETLLYLMSDDNQNPLQQTLLFLFELRP